METSAILALMSAVLLWAILSGKLSHAPLTGPLVLTVAGVVAALLFNTDAAHVGETDQSALSLESFIHLIAEITLVVVLFSDASRIHFESLATDRALPQRLLLLALPLIIIFGAVTAYWIVPGLGLAGALLLAAVLAPTDAALADSIVSNPEVPEDVRVAIETESGLNDGIALVAVLFALCMLGWTHTIESDGGWLLFGAQQVGIGTLVGIVVGVAGAWVIHWADRKAQLDASMRVVAGLAIAGVAWAGAEQLSGNGFISAFIAGLAFGRQARAADRELSDFIRAEGQLLVLGTFFLFGFGLLPQAMAALSWQGVLYAIVSLFVVRMAGVALGTLGLGLDRSTVLFVGWFGPRGLASILFALIAVNAIGESQHELVHHIAGIVYITVALSILLHGVSASYLHLTRPEAEPEKQDRS